MSLVNNSALIQAIGSTKFRFLDMSGVESKHSPKDREDAQSDESVSADSAVFDGEKIARRGHARVVDAAGDHIGWAKRNDKPIFDAAEKHLRESIRAANALIRRCTIKVGGARAVPCERYVDFENARTECLTLAANTNQSEHIVAANAILAAQGKPNMCMQFCVSWHPELTFADPADAERGERIRQSVAEAIGQVVNACRSGDREQIRYVLDQVGALGDSVSDPVLKADVKSILTAANDAAERISAEGRARSAVLRSNTQTTRGQQAASRFLDAQLDANAARNNLTETIQQFESRWAALDLKSDAEMAADLEDTLTDDDRYQRMRARLEAQDTPIRGPLEVDSEDRPLSTEAIIEIERIEQDTRFAQLEIE